MIWPVSIFLFICLLVCLALMIDKPDNNKSFVEKIEYLILKKGYEKFGEKHYSFNNVYIKRINESSFGYHIFLKEYPDTKIPSYLTAYKIIHTSHYNESYEWFVSKKLEKYVKKLIKREYYRVMKEKDELEKQEEKEKKNSRNYHKLNQIYANYY